MRARDIQISLNEQLWIRVKTFADSNERHTLNALQPRTPVPAEVGFIIGGLLFLAVGSFLASVRGAPVALWGAFVIMFSLLLLMIGIFKNLDYYGAVVLRYPVGILSKELISLATEHAPSMGYFLVAYVDRENNRLTAKLETAYSHLISVGDVGILALRAGRIVDFFRSRQI